MRTVSLFAMILVAFSSNPLAHQGLSANSPSGAQPVTRHEVPSKASNPKLRFRSALPSPAIFLGLINAQTFFAAEPSDPR